ncbi:MAG: hypothetical protein RMJ55_20385, partial [Roseiflexaceae bacterium]|nr:hypothetical protein [Roseiflexaceae bacterium]
VAMKIGGIGNAHASLLNEPSDTNPERTADREERGSLEHYSMDDREMGGKTQESPLVYERE